MKYKIFSKYYLAASVMVLTLSSCNDWLAVDMEDSIMEEKLYENSDGYMSVLNGIYSKLNEQYASTLTMSTIDVMAKLYNVGSNHNYYTYYNYNFTDANFEGMSGGVWSSLYGMIANINTLLEHCDDSKTTLAPQYIPYVKGEALALRAMLHFDLLRIYGPIYSEVSANTVCMPYQETSSKDIQPMLTAKEILEKVILDLNEAAGLLKNDRIRIEGVMNSESEDPNEGTNLRFRQYRLNYYAVQALLARAYQWQGDKTKTYQIAKSLIEENKQHEVFPWVRKSAVQGNYPDRMFSSEVIFGLYNVSRSNLYNRFFSPTDSFSNLLTFDGKSMEDGDMTSKINWFYTDVDDMRKTEMWSVETVEDRNENTGAVTQHQAICFRKYEDVPTTQPWRYMIPLIRISEVYLMAAECTTDNDEAYSLINELRRNRNCTNLTPTGNDRPSTIQNYIDNEFAREVIGEGQLYFYYKRHGMTTVLNGTSYDYASWFGATTSMSLGDYVWPLPKVETSKRVE